MTIRDNFPKPQIPRTHFFLTFSRGDRMRTFAMRPWALYALTGFLPVLCAWYLGATLYMVFRDDMLAALMSRQADVQYAYEDRIAAMRGELDRVTSHQLLNQDSFEGKVHELASRQAQLEGRAAIVASLADLANGRDATASIPRGLADARAKAAPAKITAAAPVLAGMARALPAGAVGFAPVEAPGGFPALTNAKPRPEAIESPVRADPGQRSSIEAEMPVPTRLAGIAVSLDRIEFQQVRALSQLQAPAIATAARLRTALAEAGLSPEKLTAPAKASAMGGPFVPLKVDPAGSPFEREVAHVQGAILAVEKLRRIMPYVPLRQPLPGQLEVTSTFGVRADPFFGRTALHSGMDFREDYGSPIRATAAGRIVSAGMSGGYGNMVEIDHGNGLSTRYGHMSAIVVAEDQVVAAGDIVGKLGSTGRSTGPHLHYEVRVDGEAVDPARFLKAGGRLTGRE